MSIPPKYTQAYFIITPDPTIPGTFITREGMEGFFVKFGDGSPVGRYKTCNPSFAVAINEHQLSRKLPNLSLRNRLEYTKEVKESKPHEVFAGKFLEQQYFQPASYEDTSTEWWWIAVKDTSDSYTATVDDLRNYLCIILRVFPDYNKWDDKMGDRVGKPPDPHMWDEELGGYKDKTVLDKVFSALNDTRTFSISPSTSRPRSTGDRIPRVYSTDSSQEENMHVERPTVPEFAVGGLPWVSTLGPRPTSTPPSLAQSPHSRVAFPPMDPSSATFLPQP